MRMLERWYSSVSVPIAKFLVPDTMVALTLEAEVGSPVSTPQHNAVGNTDDAVPSPRPFDLHYYRTSEFIPCCIPWLNWQNGVSFLPRRCSQQQNCTVMAHTSTFGDPCPGTLKYLEAHYQCMPGRKLTFKHAKVGNVPSCGTLRTETEVVHFPTRYPEYELLYPVAASTCIFPHGKTSRLCQAFFSLVTFIFFFFHFY